MKAKIIRFISKADLESRILHSRTIRHQRPLTVSVGDALTKAFKERGELCQS